MAAITYDCNHYNATWTNIPVVQNVQTYTRVVVREYRPRFFINGRAFTNLKASRFYWNECWEISNRQMPHVIWPELRKRRKKVIVARRSFQSAVQRSQNKRKQYIQQLRNRFIKQI